MCYRSALMPSRSTCTPGPCELRDPRSTLKNSTTRVSIVHASFFMDAKRYYSWIPLRKLGFSPGVNAAKVICDASRFQVITANRCVFPDLQFYSYRKSTSDLLFPNGSCALVVQEKDGVSTVTAYHWNHSRPQMESLSHSLIFLSTLMLRFSRRS